MRMRPTGNNVLIKRDPQPDMVTEHIVGTPAWQQAVWTGTVAAVGPGVVHYAAKTRDKPGKAWRDTLELLPGDRVQLSPHSSGGCWMDIGGESHVLIDISYILAVEAEATEAT